MDHVPVAQPLAVSPERAGDWRGVLRSRGEIHGDLVAPAALTALPVSHSIALRSAQLDGFTSSDPADRFLVATALEHGLTLVTADGAMRSFRELETLW